MIASNKFIIPITPQKTTSIRGGLKTEKTQSQIIIYHLIAVHNAQEPEVPKKTQVSV